MDFIERWLHISPDGGNGLLEAVYLAASACAIVSAGFHRRISRLAKRIWSSGH